MGGECVICKLRGPDCIYDFHHMDPEEKDFTLGSWKFKCWETIVSELKKCVMLCSNCHREFHNGSKCIPRNAKRFDLSLLPEKEFTKTVCCFYCNKSFIVPANSKRKFCSIGCSNFGREKVDWSKVDWNKNNHTISQELGVAWHSVRKHRMKYKPD
jgi:hypothetical protein